MARLAYVKGVFTEPITLSGTGQASDGQQVLGAGERWLVTANGVNNGVWTTDAAGWTRATDLNASAQFVWGTEIEVRGGQNYDGSIWYYNGVDNPTLGGTSLHFRLRSYGDPEEDGPGIVREGEYLRLPERLGIQGSYSLPDLTLDTLGQIVGIESGTTQTTALRGLRVVRASGTSVTVEAGAAWVPGSEALVGLEAALTKSGLVLTANTWHYAYLFSNAGVGDIEISTTAPAAPYLGGARTKTNDATRRYLGPPLRTDANGALYDFSYDGYLCRWLEVPSVAPFRVLSAGASGTFAGVVCSAVMPPTSTRALLRATSANGFYLTYNTISDKEITAHGAGEAGNIIAETNILQVLRYRNVGAGTSVTLDLQGFYEARA